MLYSGQQADVSRQDHANQVPGNVTTVLLLPVCWFSFPEMEVPAEFYSVLSVLKLIFLVPLED